jgi:cytochrome c peroxidase
MSRSSTNSLGAVAICLCLALAFSAMMAPARGFDLPIQFEEDSHGDEPITAIPPPSIADPLKLALGERLFLDARLSGDQKHPCSKCHDTNTNGADAASRAVASRTVDHDGAGPSFKTTTVFNAALSFRLGWMGKYRSFETQAAAALDQGGIMGTTIAEVLGRLNADAEISREFREAYGRGPDRASLLDALATFEQSLLTPGSRFDRWLGGDAAALSHEEMHGYHLFKSLGCISCHQGVNVGGNLFQRQGIFHALTSPNPGSLRVPSLRNVATTPPYFHDGSAATLEDAVRRMAAAQINLTLSEPQIGAIVAFLHTLTGYYRGNPVVAASP